MPKINAISLLGKCSSKLSTAVKTDAAIDTCKVLHDLANDKDWGEQNTQQLGFLAEKVSVFGRLQNAYDSTGRMVPDSTVLDPSWLRYFAALLLDRLTTTLCDNHQIVRENACLLNAAFKAIDHASTSEGKKVIDVELLVQAETQWVNLKKMLPLSIETPSESEPGTMSKLPRGDMKTIPLTVLYYEGPIARAYLETIQSLGMKPRRIVELVPTRDIVSGKTVGRWLPKSVRTEYSAAVHRRNMHYWASDIRQKDRDLFNSIATSVCRDLDFSPEVFYGAQKMRSLSEFSDHTERLMIESVRDPALTDYIATSDASRFLFTGGGLLDPATLSLPGTRILHVHPGYLPDIRGADCTLWSHLLYGKHSASSFYMNAGIDTGDVIDACWMPNINLTSYAKKADSKRLYRAVFAFLDPWIRANVLHRTLQRFSGDLCDYEGRPQEKTGTQTFNFLQESLREKSLSYIFDSK